MPLRGTEIPSSRAQGSGFKIRLVMGDFGVSGSIKGNKDSVVAFRECCFCFLLNIWI